MIMYALFYVGDGMPEIEEDKTNVRIAREDGYTDLGPAIVDSGFPFDPMASGCSNLMSRGEIAVFEMFEAG